MAVLDVSEKSFEIALVFASTLMLLPLQRRVFDVRAAMLAPVLGLDK